MSLYGAAPASPSLTPVPAFVTPSDHFNRLSAARAFILSSIRAHYAFTSRVHFVCCVVLGSGLGGFASALHDQLVIPYCAIPHFPRPSVSGHAGELIIGRLSADSPADCLVLCLSGRVHAYEFRSPIPVHALSFAVTVCCCMGAEFAVLTNSAGGAVRGIREGDIVCATDHLRMVAIEADAEPDTDSETDSDPVTRTDAVIKCHDAALMDLAQSCAASLGIGFHCGVYQMSPGPSYETAGEVQAGIALGVGAFGMSTVAELRACHALRVPSLALSLCTNLAAGLSSAILSHADVKATADWAGTNLVALITQIVRAKQTETPVATNRASAAVEPLSGLLARCLLSSPSTRRPLFHRGAGSEWRPDEADLRASVSMMLATNGAEFPTPRLAVVTTVAPPLHSMTDVRCIRLAELPVFRSSIVPLEHFSASVSECVVLFATVSVADEQPQPRSRRICLLAHCRADGFPSSESAVVAYCLRSIGCCALITLSRGTALNSNNSPRVALAAPFDVLSTFTFERAVTAPLLGTVLVAANTEVNRLDPSVTVADRTASLLDPMISIHSHHDPQQGASSTKATAAIAALHQSGAANALDAPDGAQVTGRIMHVMHVAESSGLVSALAGAFDQRDMVAQQETFCVLRGRASRAELAGPQKAGCTVLTRFSSALLVDAHRLGIAAAAIATVGFLITPMKQLPLSAILEIALAASHRVKSASDSAAMPPAWSLCTVASIVERPPRYDWEGVQEAARTLDCALLSLALTSVAGTASPAHPRSTAAMFLERGFLAALRHEWRQSAALPLSALLPWLGVPPSWTARLLSATDCSILAITNEADGIAAAPFAVFESLAALPRVLVAMGVTTGLAFAPLATLDPAALPFGSLCQVTDSINLTGRNPLHGPNEPRFGLRFPDSSQLYSRAPLTDAITNAPLPTTVVAAVCEPEFTALSEAQLLGALGATTRAAGLLELSVCAAHSGLRLTLVGRIEQARGKCQLAAPSDPRIVPLIDEWRASQAALARH